jgi:hypothetical protein
MSRGRRAQLPHPAVKDESSPVLPIEPRRFALVIEDGSSLVVDLTEWPGAAFTTEIAPLVRARILRMGPGLIRRSVQRLLLNLRRFWGFLSERGEMPGKLMDLTVEVIDDYESWLEREAGGRIYQRHLLAALIGVLRVGSEDHPDLLPQALLPRLRFLGHGFVGGSIPRDAYGSGIAAALRVAARGQILDARSRIAVAEDLPPHPVQIAACPMLSAHRDAVLAEIAANGQIGTRHPVFKRFANLAGRRKLDIGIEGPHRGFHLATMDLAAFLILLSLETGMEAESLIRLKADCLCNPTKGYVEIVYHKRRARGSEWKRLRVRDGSSATPGGLIRLAIALTERARRHLETDRLWVLWTVAGLRAAGEDMRKGIDAFVKHHGLNAQCVGATGSCAFGSIRCNRSGLSRAASTRMSAVCTTRLRLRSDRPFTLAQRSSSDRYRSSSGRLNHSDDTRPFRSPRLTSTFQPPARVGATGSRTSTTPINYLPRRAPGATLPALNPSPGNRHSSHSRRRSRRDAAIPLSRANGRHFGQ